MKNHKSTTILLLLVSICILFTGCLNTLDNNLDNSEDTGNKSTEKIYENIYGTSDVTPEVEPTATEIPSQTQTPHIHNYSAATCTEPEKCLTCGEKGKDVTDHKWENATCDTPKTCTYCGKKEGSKLSHNYYKGSCIYCKTQNPSYNVTTNDSSSADENTIYTENTTTNSTTVWIPKTGTKYHNNPNCSNMKNPSKVTLSQAINKGYGPCKKCY